MINHARTLLLNVAAKSNQITPDTEAEFVPAEFTPVVLPNELKLLRRMLFGSSPDGRFINMRVKELMGYVHQTELAQYVYDLDSRVTYWPPQSAELTTTNKTVVTTQLYGDPLPLTIVGEARANHSVGRAIWRYLLAAGLNNPESETPETVLTIQQLGTVDQQQTFSVNDVGSTAVATLPNTGLKIPLTFAFTFPGEAALSGEDITQLLYEAYADAGPLLSEQLANTLPLSNNSIESLLAQWFVTVTATPDPIITTLMPTLELLGEPVFLSLFGLTNEEPYATFKNLWFDHYSPVYKLAGLTMAAIYRTEELRRGSNG